MCIFGSAGTGKRFVLKDIAREAARSDLRIAIPSFTGLVADHYRRECSFATCDTVHGLLGTGANADMANMVVNLLRFNLIVVDEIFMIPPDLCQKLIRAWLLADRLPVLVFGGDEGGAAAPAGWANFWILRPDWKTAYTLFGESRSRAVPKL